MLFLFVFGFLPQRFLLELDFTESDFSYPVIWPSSLDELAPATPKARHPIARTAAERLWAEYSPLAAAGELEAASQLLARHLERHPLDVGVRLEYARVLWKMGRLEPAIAAYREALRSGDRPSARRELAQLYADARRWDEAIALYRGLAGGRPADLGLWLEYARAATAAERYGEAVKAYEHTLERRPGDASALQAYVDVAKWAGDYGRALSGYARLVELRPGDLDLIGGYAETATWAEEYDVAAALYERLLRARPGDPQLTLNLARVLYWGGEYARASGVLETLPPEQRSISADSLINAIAASLPPRDTLAPIPLEVARGLMMAGAVDSALVLYRGVLADGPVTDSLLLELAAVFEFRADVPDSAMAYLRLYLERRPADRDARLHLARLLAWSNHTDEAEAELEAILSAGAGGATEAEAWTLLGDLRRWRGELVAADRAYARALAIEADEAAALEGRAALEARAEALLAERGSIGPAAAFEYFADSDEFSRARWSGGWTVGDPASHGGMRASVERLSGYDLGGGGRTLSALEVGAGGERWWRLGTFQTAAYLGAWIPDGGASAEPVAMAAAEAPELGGARYRLEYRHEPAFRETATLESALADLRMDQLSLSTYRVLSERWELSLRGRAAAISGSGDDNVRGDAAAGIFFRPDERWLLGLESRGLAFADAAPRLGRRLYWDPEWSWESVALIGWAFEPAEDWRLEARAVPGVAWLRERDRDAEIVFVGGASLEARYRAGAWTVAGLAGFNQSRAGDYRALRLQLGLERGFTR
jgi:tetratricopeptide (TPR) repeat protein